MLPTARIRIWSPPGPWEGELLKLSADTVPAAVPERHQHLPPPSGRAAGDDVGLIDPVADPRHGGTLAENRGPVREILDELPVMLGLQKLPKDATGPNMRVVHEQPAADLQSSRRVIPVDEYRREGVTSVQQHQVERLGFQAGEGVL